MGQRRKKMGKLEGNFNPKEFEDEIYEGWEKKGFFKPSDDKKKEAYCIVMPHMKFSRDVRRRHHYTICFFLLII